MPILEVLDLSAGFDNKILYENISFSVDKKEKILITGENGCGKTTLLKCILGIEKPLKGKIKKSYTPAYVKQLGIEKNFPLSVEEVISIGKPKQNIDYYLKKTNCLHLKKRNYFSLSGGERQRVSIARCLAQNAKIVLMDEPTAFLDSESRKGLAKILQNLDDLAIILVTHDSILVDVLGWRNICLN